jgi:zinc dependent phospholipase C
MERIKVRRARCSAPSARCVVRRAACLVLALLTITCLPRPAAAYSVLAHEACVDALWKPGIEPLLTRRFPRATPADLQAARAYAYGGSVIQDLGYYPFGSRFFSNLVHYVRAGDFIEALVRNAHDVNEFAFALGALAHYAADSVGHPEAVNPSVPLMFPKLRAKFGDTVTYAQSPSSHVRVEYSFDIVQIAAGAYLPESYHSFIGFQVARPLMDRAFAETYSLETKDIFNDEGLAISSYRKAVSELIPEFTRIAWRDKRDEIARVIPNVREHAFVYEYTQAEFEREFGTGYGKRGWFARMLGTFYRIIPKIGPLKQLKFKAPTPEAQALFMTSFKDARARYAEALAEVGQRSLDMANVNFDLGRRSVHGEYPLADETYARLLDELARRKFAGVPVALRRDIGAYYARATAPLDRNEQKRVARIRVQLAAMNAPNKRQRSTSRIKRATSL